MKAPRRQVSHDSQVKYQDNSTRLGIPYLRLARASGAHAPALSTERGGVVG